MNFFFVTRAFSGLADAESRALERTRQALRKRGLGAEVGSPEAADVLLMQEVFSSKDARYARKVLSDPLLANHLARVFTLNFDDYPTGLFRGLYANMPNSRLEPGRHAAVPYADYFNELVFAATAERKEPEYLATWRGNPASNRIRPLLAKLLQDKPDCRIERTTSWLNHSAAEKSRYVSLLRNGRFSLCPAGLAPASFRLYESMALGVCPVILADDFAPPRGVAWHDFALFYPEAELAGLHGFLVRHQAAAAERGQQARQAWHQHFRAEILPDYYADSLLALIRAAPACSAASEAARWNSPGSFWRG